MNFTLGKLKSLSINKWPKTGVQLTQNTYTRKSGHSFEDSQVRVLAIEASWFKDTKTLPFQKQSHQSTRPDDSTDKGEGSQQKVS